ncbi:MAG: hypothetical protein AAFU56_00600 [Pseudomonadota bacterium]
MSDAIATLVKKIAELEGVLETIFAEKRKQIAFRFEKHKVIVERHLTGQHKRFRIGILPNSTGLKT